MALRPGSHRHEQHWAYLRQSRRRRRVGAVHRGPSRVLEHDDDSIRAADEWERDEVLLQMLVWRDRFVVSEELFEGS
jgi:hypothetical protein